MNKKMVLSLGFLVVAFTLSAGQPPPPYKGSPEFERMKALVGTWKGTHDMGQGPIDITMHYRLLAGGSVLEERVFEGTPNEMITMYYDQGGKLALTHYCIMGNRPGMLLKSSDSKSIAFDFDATCGIQAPDAGPGRAEPGARDAEQVREARHEVPVSDVCARRENAHEHFVAAELGLIYVLEF